MSALCLLFISLTHCYNPGHWPLCLQFLPFSLFSTLQLESFEIRTCCPVTLDLRNCPTFYQLEGLELLVSGLGPVVHGLTTFFWGIPVPPLNIEENGVDGWFLCRPASQRLER